MSGYNPPRWSGVGAHVSPLASKVFIAALSRANLEETLRKVRAPAAARAEALATWDSMRAASMLYDQKALGKPAPEPASSPVESLEPASGGIMSADAAGKLLGLSGRRVRGLVAEGKLPGERQGNRQMVERAAVETMAVKRATENDTLPGPSQEKAA